MKSDKNARIFVAGDRGMVGSAIVRKLETAGYDNIITVGKDICDLRNQSEVHRFFEDQKPDYVFIAAAKVGGIMANKTYKADFIYDNLMIAANLIHASYLYKVKKVLNLGSSCIYPKFAPQPIKEEYLLTSDLEPTNQPYAIAKIAAIELCKSYNFQYGTDFISLMPTNLYGTGDNYNLETSHVLPAIIRKMLLAKWLMEGQYSSIISDFKKNTPGFEISSAKEQEQSINRILSDIGITDSTLTLWGTGKALREFLHTDDLADAAIYFMENHSFSSIRDFVNIGSGKEITIRDLAYLIKNIIGYDGDILFDKSKPDGTPRKLLDVSKAKLLGWTHKIELVDGIKTVVRQYLGI